MNASRWHIGYIIKLIVVVVADFVTQLVCMMENWQSGLFILRQILGVVSANNAGSEREIRNIVQQELRNSSSSDQTDFLRDVMRMIEERNRADQREEERNLKTKVEELSRKLEKIDREKKVSDNRTWMMGVLEKISAVQTKGHVPTRGRGGRGSFGGRPGNDSRKDNDHLPWTDGPKGEHKNQAVTTEDSFVMVNRQDCFSKQRGRGGFNRGRGGFHRGRGGSHRGRGQNHGSGGHDQGEEEDEEQQSTQHQARGTSRRGHSRGAIPKTVSGGRSSGKPSGGSESSGIQQLSAKLQQLSTSDVQISLTPEEIIAIKNALKEKNVSEDQQKGKPKPPNQKSAKKKPPTQRPEAQQNNTPQEPLQHSEEQQPQQQKKEIKSVRAKKQADDANNNPTSQVPVATPPSAALPLQLYPVAGFSDSVLQILPGSQPLEDAMLLVMQEGRVLTHQPRTVQELKDFKSKHPTAELFSLKPPSS